MTHPGRCRMSGALNTWETLPPAITSIMARLKSLSLERTSGLTDSSVSDLDTITIKASTAMSKSFVSKDEDKHRAGALEAPGHQLSSILSMVTSACLAPQWMISGS